MNEQNELSGRSIKIAAEPRLYSFSSSIDMDMYIDYSIVLCLVVNFIILLYPIYWHFVLARLRLRFSRIVISTTPKFS
jgi:hypothetical protein